jgi:hypothetical protein
MLCSATTLFGGQLKKYGKTSTDEQAPPFDVAIALFPFSVKE